MSAKAALIAMTKHAAVELVRDNVLVNSVAPGSIIHPGGSWERFSNEQPSEVVEKFIDKHLPLGRFGWPEPIGDIVAFIASERASHDHRRLYQRGRRTKQVYDIDALRPGS